MSTIESYVTYMTTIEEEIKEYAKLFWVLDRNRNGFIEKQELERAFMTSGLICSEGQTDYVLKRLETQPSGRINYTQFVTMLSGRSKLYAKQSLVQAFAYLDENSNGFIERS